MKAKLAAQEVELAQKNEEANKLIQIVGVETEKVSKEKAIADEEERKVQVINEEVSKKAADCERDLAKAEPALAAAQEALNTLNKVKATYIFLLKSSFIYPGICTRVNNTASFHQGSSLDVQVESFSSSIWYIYR